MRMSSQYNHLSAALDSREMQERLRKQFELIKNEEVKLKNFQVARVFLRSDQSFTIQYRMNVLTAESKTPAPLILCGHLLGEFEDWPEYIRTNQQQVMVFEDLRLVVPMFPFDPRLPAIAELCVKGNLPEIIKRSTDTLIAEYPDAGIVDFEVLGYRLERRCVIRHLLGSQATDPHDGQSVKIVTKIIKAAKAKEMIKAVTLLNQGGFVGKKSNGLTVPKTYHIDVEGGVYISEFVPGESLHDLTGDKQFFLACECAAATLQKLHRVDSSSLSKYTVNDESNSLDEKIGIISSIFPDLAASFESTWRSIKSSSQELDDNLKAVCIHRDFYDKQVLYTAERTTLLDCDSLAGGDPAQDCGNFIAHLMLRQLQEPANAKNIGEGIKAFKRIYRISDKNMEKRVNWWLVATLLRLAFLYSLRPRWHQLTRSLLNIANFNVQMIQTQMEGVNENYSS